MPDTVYTRLNGYQPTGSEVNLGDRLFNGSAGVNPLLRNLAGGTPYIGPAYMAGRGVNALLHYLGKLGVFGSPTAGGTGGDTPVSGPQQMPTNSETNNPPMYGGQGGRPSQPYDMNGILNMWNQHFPGSALGRFAQGPAYGAPGTRGAAGLGTPNSVSTGLSGPAVDWRAELARRHQR